MTQKQSPEKVQVKIEVLARDFPPGEEDASPGEGYFPQVKKTPVLVRDIPPGEEDASPGEGYSPR